MGEKKTNSRFPSEPYSLEAVDDGESVAWDTTVWTSQTIKTQV